MSSCSTSLSVAVTNNMIKSNLERKGLLGLHFPMAVDYCRKPTQGRNMEAEIEERPNEYCLLAIHCLFGLLSYTTQDRQPRPNPTVG